MKAKELTIEEKAKAYDRALANAKEQAIDGYLDAVAVNDIFPELKQSEDDRIREKVIDVLKLNVRGAEAQMQASRGIDRTFEVYACNKVIAWLEKQGEQKPADKLEPKFNVGDVMRTLQEATNNITSGLPVVVSIDDKYYRCNNELIAIKDQDDYEYPPMNRKQKPAEWSEEDEDNLTDIFVAIDNFHTTNHKKELITFLKSLKAKVQPKQKWSEEDERLREYCINAINGIHYYSPENKQELVGWLKFLKDRYTWKPSEEQMIALRQVISGCSYDIEPLLELETKLKEL